MNKLSIQFNSEISKESTEIRISFYANIGFFIEVAQMLEFNLRKLLCYELSVKEIEKINITKENVLTICKKYDEYYFQTYTEKWTLGRLKDEINKTNFSYNDKIKTISEINDFRIQLVHKIFQNNITSKSLCCAENVKNYIETRVIPMTDKTIDFNEKIINHINLYKHKLHRYKENVGVPIDN